ncbi:MAG: polysaccharide lyase family 8 super-sandwich domain-containing protein, partial [Bacteroidota bacterium]|nr:polysaccharide lyase family 8 super-sandwich domain-containing protein [Bacteroidota bacterium]
VKTEFAFGAVKEKILFDYCSNGLRWTIFDKGMDITAIGRQLRFNCDLKRGMDLNSNFNLIQSSYPVDACSFNLDGFDTDKSKQCTLVGNRGFWRSDYMVYLKGNNYMMSVKTHGEYVKKIESINSENLKGAFLNDGVSLIQSNGKEYRNIEPLWNWTMLPGTTCDTTIDPGSPNTFKTNNQSQFVGQVSDGTSGISAMDYNRSTVRAHKSYFFTDNLMVALGSGIGSANAKNLVTTINQRFLNHHKVYTSTSRFKTNRWIWHDSIAYIFPGNQTPIVRTEWRTGEWNKVDMVSKTATAKDSILSIFLPQSNNDSYAYIVKPACPLEGITKITEQKDMKILSNTPDVQAIQSKSLVMAVFYNSSLLKVPNGEMIRVNHPCILLYKHDDKKREVWISDPTRKLATIQILIDGKSHDITLPSGDYAGSTLKTFFPE